MTGIANLVQQRTASLGSGALLLSAVAGCRSFADAFGTGGNDMFFYCIRHRGAGEWEVGTGHMSDAATLVRDHVIASSNDGSKVSFSAGEKDVVNDIAAERQIVGPAAPQSGDMLVFDGNRWQAAKPGIAAINGLGTALSGKAAALHSHTTTDVTGLSAALSAKANAAHSHAVDDIGGLSAALSAKADQTHSHAAEDIEGLAAALAGITAADHSHASTDIEDLPEILAAYAREDHGHAMTDVEGLTAALSAKAATTHSHMFSDITGLGDALDSRAAASHTHSISGVTGLEDALTAKAAAARIIATAGSLTGGGDLSSNRSLSLSGDAETPGAGKYYGTNEAGEKGFHDLPATPEMPEPEPPAAEDVLFDPDSQKLVLGPDVQSALHSADTHLLRSGFHPKYSTHVNHFTGGDYGGFVPAVSGTGANANTLEPDYTINTDALGVYRMTTGTTAAGAAWRSMGNSMCMLHRAGKILRLQSRIRLANLTAAGSQEFRVWGGVTVGTAVTSNPATVIGMYWYYDKDNTKWVLRRRNMAAVQDVATDVTVEAGVWYDMELVITGAAADGDITAELFINGASCAVNSQLISSMNYNPVSAAIQKAVGTTARLLYIDYEALFMERA